MGSSSIYGVIDVETEIISGVKQAGFAHEVFGQILPEHPDALFLGIGQSRFGQRLPKSKELTGLRSRIEAFDNIAQLLPPCQLGEGHGDKPLATTKMLHARLGTVALHQAGERLAVDEIEDFGENVTDGVHGSRACRPE